MYVERKRAMKRKLLLFAGVLILMLVVKYAVGQNDSSEIGWNVSEDPSLEWIRQ